MLTLTSAEPNHDTGSLPAPRRAKHRVLFLLPSLAGGGSERVVVTLLEHLDRERFDVHLGVLDATGPLLDQLRTDVDLRNLNRKRLRNSIGPLLRLIWKLRPDAVLSTLGHLNLALLALRSLLPRNIRLCVRESTIVSAAIRVEGQSQTWARMYRGLYPTADAVVCQSDYMKDDLSRTFGIASNKLVRIYNPVDVDRLSEMAQADSPFSGRGPQLIASGRLEHAKGFDGLLTSMSLVRRLFPDVRLTILGEGTLAEALHSQCKALALEKTVSFAGFMPNPYRYYAHADLFVLSSRYEGLPNAMLEAMMLGTPVVATDCPGGVREVLRYSTAHRLAPVDDPAALAANIIAALGQGRRPAVTEQQELRAMVNLEKVISQYETLLLN